MLVEGNPAGAIEAYDMFKDKRVIVVMPAYNAAQTLHRTYDEVMHQDYVDQVIVVDDRSQDDTVPIAQKLPGTLVYAHEKNMCVHLPVGGLSASTLRKRADIRLDRQKRGQAFW